MNIASLAVLYAGLLLAAAPASQPNEDWPRWRGPHGDGISRATGLADRWPQDGPKKLWSDERAGKGFASPVAVDGKVFVFSVIDRNDTLTAYDASTGRVLWREAYANSFLVTRGGTRATPTVEGNRIYTYGGAGDLVCRELADGRLLWQLNILTETKSKNLTWGTASSPLVLGELVYVQAGSDGPAAVAVNKQTGQIAWRSQSPGPAGYAPIVPIDVAGRRQLIVFAGRTVLAIDPASGKTIWSHPWPTQFGVNAATPIYRDGLLFLTSGYNHGCVMLRVAADGPDKQFQLRRPDCKFPSPILDGDYLYAVSEELRGAIVCLRWRDGKVIWINKDRQLELGFGGSLVGLPGRRMLALSDTGRLLLLSVTADGIEILGAAQSLPEEAAKEVWATPLVYRGRLYVRGGQTLVCLDIGAAE